MPMPDAPITRTLVRTDTDTGRPVATEPFMQMVSGRCVPLLSPKPEDIDIRDIAHGLARIQRFQGQIVRAYSVAEHSLRVADVLAADGAPPGLELAGLLHDAAEYVTGDIVQPVKAAWEIMDGGSFSHVYRAMEARLQAAIHGASGLPVLLPASWAAAIRAADLRVFVTEVRDLRPDPLLADWPDDITPLPGRIAPLTRDDAEAAFRARFALLQGRRQRDDLRRLSHTGA